MYRKFPWSKKLHHASPAVRYSSIVHKEKLHKINNFNARTAIRSTLPELPKQLPTNNNFGHQIKQSRRSLQEVRINAVNERKAFLQELKERISTRKYTSDGDPVKALKCVNSQLQGKS